MVVLFFQFFKKYSKYKDNPEDFKNCKFQISNKLKIQITNSKNYSFWNLRFGICFIFKVHLQFFKMSYSLK